jgi:hypothetical protein
MFNKDDSGISDTLFRKFLERHNKLPIDPPPPNSEDFRDQFLKLLDEPLGGKEGKESIFVHPLKIYWSAEIYARSSIRSLDAWYELDLVLDKLLLAGCLRKLFSDLDTSNPDKKNTKEWLDELVIKKLKSFNQLSPLTSAENSVTFKDTLELDPGIWQELIRYSSLYDDDRLIVLFPLVDLNEAASILCETITNELFSDEDKGLKEKWDPVVKALVDSGEKIKGIGHGIFYSAIDAFRTSDSSLNPLKEQFRPSERDLPSLQKIDLRPSVWQSLAAAISNEMLIARKKHELALTHFEKQTNESPANLIEFEHAAARLREATDIFNQVLILCYMF